MASPHDSLFKSVFGQPDNARGALRAVVPPALRDALDWATLSREPGSFVDPALNERHTDLLFSAALRDGGDALLYILFEHQSTPEPLMAYRLLRYLVRIWEGWLADHANATKLPAIVPVVLYHGHAPWTAAHSFEQLLDVPETVRTAAARHVPQFTYVLDDLSDVSDDELRHRAASAAVTAAATAAMVCFKHGRSQADMVAVLANWTDVLNAVVAAPNGLEALARVMRYILMVNDHARPEALEALLEREVGPEAKETLVTVGQQLIEQGIRRGRQQGIEQGERMFLLRQLRTRFGDAVDASVEQLIASASVAQLEVWGDRVLSAATLADVLTD